MVPTGKGGEFIVPLSTLKIFARSIVSTIFPFTVVKRCLVTMSYPLRFLTLKSFFLFKNFVVISYLPDGKSIKENTVP